jgi:CHASE3 domain sensor protein
MKQSHNRVQALEKEANNLFERTRKLREDEKDRQEQIKDLQSRLAKWKRELDQPLELGDAEAIQREMVTAFCGSRKY